MIAKITDFVKSHHSDITLVIAICCITIISFNLGRMSAGEGSSAIFHATYASPAVSSSATPITTPKDPRVVASKASSSHLYHFTYCSGAARISDKNKIYFPTEAAAIAAGYSLAGNCTK